MRVKAFVAQLHTKLVFAPGTKIPVALVAGGDLLVVCLFGGVDFRMDFDHCSSPTEDGQTDCHAGRLKTKDL
jgi:hypothetical protein